MELSHVDRYTYINFAEHQVNFLRSGIDSERIHELTKLFFVDETTSSPRENADKLSVSANNHQILIFLPQLPIDKIVYILKFSQLFFRKILHRRDQF